MGPRTKCNYLRNSIRVERENCPGFFFPPILQCFATDFNGTSQKVAWERQCALLSIWGYRDWTWGKIRMDLSANRQMFSTGSNYISGLFSDDSRHFRMEKVKATEVTLIKCLLSVKNLPSTWSVIPWALLLPIPSICLNGIHRTFQK